MRHPGPENRSGGHLKESPGNGEFFNAQKVCDGKVQPHSEHQEHDAHFHQLRGNIHVRHRPPGVFSGHDARNEVAYERRKAAALCNVTKTDSQSERNRKRRDQRQRVIHTNVNSEKAWWGNGIFVFRHSAEHV